MYVCVCRHLSVAVVGVHQKTIPPTATYKTVLRLRETCLPHRINKHAVACVGGSETRDPRRDTRALSPLDEQPDAGERPRENRPPARTDRPDDCAQREWSVGQRRTRTNRATDLRSNRSFHTPNTQTHCRVAVQHVVCTHVHI